MLDQSKINAELNLVTLVSEDPGFLRPGVGQMYTRASFGCNQHEERNDE